MSTEIVVHGTYSAFQAPERGTVHASLARLTTGGRAAVTWWSAGRLRTSSERPWNKDGKILPLIHRADVDVEVKFRDFTALSDWVSASTRDITGFRIQRVRWALTAKRRDELAGLARVRAVRDALARAQLYADALELGKVAPVAIADVGMLGGSLYPPNEPSGGYQRGASIPKEQGAELVPEDIEVSAAVDARFVVLPSCA
ncbi:SIMPL domain-containing protein [Skermania piniformis]|uniref:SIMPL domain-containing protein n=1 Tax=Skermania pinensis TaxID=39122 RepID=A0ABX8SB95_9ACTN|nr:SIMPL domain-containing protein [Skermania piniformis]QXQ12991.1 SIMPL domain-containing protein [Skermania piniformis]